MVIYLDIIVLENIVYDFVILLSTEIILKEKIKLLKILIAASVGSIYSTFMIFSKNSIYLDFLGKILISIIMLRIISNNKNLLKKISCFYLITFIYGGIYYALITLRSNYMLSLDKKILIILVLLIGIILIIYLKNYDKKKSIYNMEIFYENKFIKVKALLDSGNLLKDPISNRSVVIVEKECLKDIYSSDILNNLNNILNGKWIGENKDINFRLIPYSTIGKENGLLIGFVPDYIKFSEKNLALKDKAIIAIYDGNLSLNNSYNALISLDILENCA